MYLSLFPHPVFFATHSSTHRMYVYMYVGLYACMYVCMYVCVCMHICMNVCMYVCMHECMYYILHPRKLKFLQGSYIPHKQIPGHHLKLNPTFLVTSAVINNLTTLCYTLWVITASLSNPDMQNNAARVT